MRAAKTEATYPVVLPFLSIVQQVTSEKVTATSSIPCAATTQPTTFHEKTRAQSLKETNHLMVWFYVLQLRKYCFDFIV